MRVVSTAEGVVALPEKESVAKTEAEDVVDGLCATSNQLVLGFRLERVVACIGFLGRPPSALGPSGNDRAAGLA
jgi:hypothetical protein